MKNKLINNRITCAAAAVAGLALMSGCCSSGKGGSAYYYGETSQSTQTSSAQQPQEISAGTNTVIPLYKENLAVGTRQVDAGSVRIKKIVKTETVNQPVELRHEEITIERQPAGSQSSQASMPGQAFQEQEMTINLTKEEPVVEKQTSSAGQIVLQKSSQTEQKNIQAQVRSEDVDVVKFGNPENVNIGQGVNTAAGGAESSGGQAMGASSSGTITDPAMLSSSGGSLTGRQVQFSNCRVQNVIGDHVAVLSSGNGQSFYVYSESGTKNLKAGDTVSLSGSVKSGASDLNGGAAQVLSSQPMYIDAQTISASGQ
jgi:uncharacterized protein (TIGR02271 family)